MLETEGMSVPKKAAVFMSQVRRMWYQRGGLTLFYIPLILHQCGEMLEREGRKGERERDSYLNNLKYYSWPWPLG